MTRLEDKISGDLCSHPVQLHTSKQAAQTVKDCQFAFALATRTFHSHVYFKDRRIGRIAK